MAKQIKQILEAYKGASAKGKSCVTKVMKQGKDMSAAIAICRASLGEAFEGKPAAALTESQIEEVVSNLQNKLQEAGARHSREDSTALQEIHDMAVKLGATCPDMLERLQQHV